MRKGLIIFLVLVIVGICVTFVFFKNQEKKVVKVNLGSVNRGELNLKVRARGRIEAEKRIELKAKRGGVVTFILEEGTKIKEGEIIALLDDKELLARKKEQEALLLTRQNELNQLKRALDLQEVEKKLESARISYEEIHRQFLIAEKLFESKTISLDEFKRTKLEDEKAKIALDLVEEQLQEAKASHQERDKQIENQIISINTSLSFIEQQLNWSVITSPINGIIIYKQVDKDTYVSPSQILLVVTSTDSFIVKSDIDESEIGKIGLGMKVEVLPDAFQDKTISGIITKIAPSPLLQTKINAFEITVRLEKTHLPIKSEMLCDLVILSDRRENVLKVAYEAILFRDKKSYCFVVENNKVRRQEVSLGLITPNEVEILSGLKQGEGVVLNPSPDLKDKEDVHTNKRNNKDLSRRRGRF
ncbi:MAG: efflux RND transporter periplasmic adaptor subunit [bacterium]